MLYMYVQLKKKVLPIIMMDSAHQCNVSEFFCIFKLLLFWHFGKKNQLSYIYLSLKTQTYPTKITFKVKNESKEHTQEN